MQANTSRDKSRYRHWLGRAALRALLVIVLVTIAVFFLLRLVPGDPAVMVLGEHATTASIEALREKRIMGAALDVFPMEPLPSDYRFLGLDNVTLTNHRGGDTINSYIKAPELLAEYMSELLETGSTRYMAR